MPLRKILYPNPAKKSTVLCELFERIIYQTAYERYVEPVSSRARQNTIFSGDIVYNKNSENPAHFILRLKSLEKAAPTYDLAESSANSISKSGGKVNSSEQIILEKSVGGDTFIVAECVPDTEAKQIHIISARIKKGGKGQVLNMESVDSPQRTSRTSLDYDTAVNSISKSGGKVNSSEQIIRENL